MLGHRDLPTRDSVCFGFGSARKTKMDGYAIRACELAAGFKSHGHLIIFAEVLVEIGSNEVQPIEVRFRDH